MSMILHVAKTASKDQALRTVLGLISTVDKDTQAAKVWLAKYASNSEHSLEAAIAKMRQAKLSEGEVKYAEKSSKKMAKAFDDFKKKPCDDTAWEIYHIGGDFHGDVFDPEADLAEEEAWEGPGHPRPERSRPILRAFADAQLVAGNTARKFMDRFYEKVQSITSDMAQVMIHSVEKSKWKTLIEDVEHIDKREKNVNIFDKLTRLKKGLEKLRDTLTAG